MNFDRPSSLGAITYTYDSSGRLQEVRGPMGSEWRAPDSSNEGSRTSAPQLLGLAATAPFFECEHDNELGVFRLKRPDAETEVFRARPVRYLVVKPDSETGETKPVVRRGSPTYVYLCREEREIR
jgi:hypothetical protein